MDDTISNQLRKKGISPEKSKMPKHIALTVGGLRTWAKKHGTDLKHSTRNALKNIFDLLKLQMSMDIPMMTLYLVNTKISHTKDFTDVMDELADFFIEILQNKDIENNKVKISILGKWYDLPSRVVEPIKAILDSTKDYDSFFLNLCVNYDGREEIVDACKIILRKALIQKIDADTIDSEMIKDNIYSSYFLPPDLIVKTGSAKRLHGFLLWDCPEAIIIFSDIPWNDFNEKDFINSIRYYQENKMRGIL